MSYKRTPVVLFDNIVITCFLTFYNIFMTCYNMLWPIYICVIFLPSNANT